MVEVLVAPVVALMMVQLVMTTPSEQAMAEEVVAVMILVLAETEAREDSLAEAAVEAVPITRVARLLQVAQAEMESSECGFTNERHNKKKSSWR